MNCTKEDMLLYAVTDRAWTGDLDRGENSDGTGKRSFRRRDHLSAAS